MFLGQLPPRKITPTPKLTLTLTLTRGQFFSGAVVWLSPTLKLTLTLTETPALTGGGGGRAIVRILYKMLHISYYVILDFL